MKLVALVLSSLIFLNACAGTVAKTSMNAGGNAAPGTTEVVRPEASARNTPKSSVWPWVIGGVTLAAAATVALVYLAAESTGRAMGHAAANSFSSGSGGSDRSSGPITVAGR